MVFLRGNPEDEEGIPVRNKDEGWVGRMAQHDSQLMQDTQLGMDRFVWGLYAFLIIGGFVATLGGGTPVPVFRAFLWALFLFMCNSIIALIYVDLRDTTRGPAETGVISDTLIILVTFFGRLWAWGFDGVMIWTSMTGQTHGAQHWHAWGSAPAGQVIAQDILWLARQSVVWGLKPWGKHFPSHPAFHDTLTSQAMNTLGGLWWRYDVSLGVVTIILSALLSRYGRWEARHSPVPRSDPQTRHFAQHKRVEAADLPTLLSGFNITVYWWRHWQTAIQQETKAADLSYTHFADNCTLMECTRDPHSHRVQIVLDDVGVQVVADGGWGPWLSQHMIWAIRRVQHDGQPVRLIMPRTIRRRRQRGSWWSI